jgi:membrane protein DedA with SNARE-associated domain
VSALIHQFTDWYLSLLDTGGYWLIAGLMALESTIVPIPSETIIPPAAFIAHTRGHLSLVGIVLAGTAGSYLGAAIMYGLSRALGRPLVMRLGPYVGLATRKIELAERWAARVGWAGVFIARLLPVIRHLIGIPAGILELDFRRYSLATLAGSLLWCTVLAELGATLGAHPELIQGSLRRFALLVLAVSIVLYALYYLFVVRAARDGASAR